MTISPTRQNRRPWPLWMLPPLLLAGAVGPAQAQSGLFKDLVDKVTKEIKLPTVPSQTDAAQSAAAETAARQAGTSAPLLMATRDDNSMRTLFAKGTVTGVDLLGELRSVRRVAGDRRSPGVSSLLSGAVTANTTAAAEGLFGGLFQGGAQGVAMKGVLAVAEAALMQTALSVATLELGRHLDFLIGDTKALEAETVKLPSANNLTKAQMQRAVNLSAIVVAMRITNRMLKQAEQDLASLDQEYATLIARRENAATLLQQALVSGLPDAAGSSFSPAELDYLRSISTSDFVHDMGAQNLALRLVAATDTKAFAEYKAQSQAATKRQTAALRTLAGVSAFGGLLTLTGRELAKMGKEQPIAELLAFGPLGFNFITELPTALTSVAKIGTSAANDLLSAGKAFRVTVDGKTEEVGSASAVFETLARTGDLPELQRALFRNDGRGLLFAVNKCDPVTAAQMLDSATTGELRQAFARETRQPTVENFSFVDAFTPGEGAQTDLATELLSRDHRPRLDREPAMARVQTGVAGSDDGGKPGFLGWNKPQLLRMLFVSREGSAAQYAMLEVGKVSVRPVPSGNALYAYEMLADACRNQFTPAPLRATTPTRPTTPSPAPGPRPPKKT